MEKRVPSRALLTLAAPVQLAQAAQLQPVLAANSSVAYCACGELRRASLAPAVFDSMRSKLPSGDWFLVSSGQASLDGNDRTAETPGLCVPGRLAAWASINSTEQTSDDNDNCHQKLVQHRKTHVSWMRLQKMTRCVSLVTQHERSRHLQYAFLFLTRPDLYLCSVSRFDLTALPEQKIMFLGQGWGVEHNEWMMEWWTLCATTYCCEARHSTLAGAAPHV